MVRIRDRFVFLAAMAGHFLLQVVTFFWMFSLSMGRAESKSPAGLLELIVTAVTGMLAFPLTVSLVTIGGGIFWGPLGWIPIVANSALWAGAVVLLRRYVVRSRSRHAL
jgi:hypothetical protein